MNKNRIIIGAALCTLALTTGCGGKQVETIPSESMSSIVIDRQVTVPPTEETTTEIETTSEIYYEPEEVYVEEYYYEEPVEYYYKEDTSGEYSPYDLMYLGEIYWGGWRFTWYSENVLPGGGLNIPGRWSDGNFVRDESGNLCLASSDLPYGSVVLTPWGYGIVYDSGCDSGTIDVYTSW